MKRLNDIDKRKKLNEEQVLEIKELLRKGMSQRNIALKYKISQSSINKINKERTWKEVEEKKEI